MVQATRPLTFEEFLESRPEDGRFELVNGEIVRILATRQHDNVAEFISDTFKAEKIGYKCHLEFPVELWSERKLQTAEYKVAILMSA